MIRAAGSPPRWALFGVRPLLRWYRGRVVVLGDAAHGMLPRQRQGANASIEDAFALAALLADADLDDLEPVLARFQGMRRARTRKIQRSSWVTNSLLHLLDGPATRGARREGGHGAAGHRLAPRLRHTGGAARRRRDPRLQTLWYTRSPQCRSSEQGRSSGPGRPHAAGRSARRYQGGARRRRRHRPVGGATLEAQFGDDLGVDSLTMVDVVVAAEDQFALIIPDDDWARFVTVGDAVAYLVPAALLPR